MVLRRRYSLRSFCGRKIRGTMAGSNPEDRGLSFGRRLPQHPTHRLYLVFCFTLVLVLGAVGLLASGSYRSAAEIGGLGAGGGCLALSRILRRRNVTGQLWCRRLGWGILGPIVLWHAIQLVQALQSWLAYGG